MPVDEYKMDETTTLRRDRHKPGRFVFSDFTKNYIRDNFKMRECYKYKETSNFLCACNKNMIDHRDTLNLSSKWSYDHNTVLKPCDSYGYISFSGYDYIPPGHYTKFIRFDSVDNCDKACEAMFDLLTKHEPYKIKEPKLIISINGGLKKMKAISNQQRKNFKQGLIDVIKKDQTWVLGSGFNVGIHKLVSSTINEFRLQQENMKDKVSLIGISTWGVVNNNDKLTQQNVDSSNTIRSNLFKYERTLNTERKKVTLDALYDNLIFCDDGTEKQYDKEIEFKLKFESYIKIRTDGFLVQILFEGGRRAIRNAFNSLKNKVPLVVIKGSGRAANIISLVMELPTKKKSRLIENINSIINEHKDLLDIPEDDKAEEEINFLTEICTEFKNQVVIYNMMDTSVRFDKKILEAMIIGAGESLKKTLKVCMRFDCPTIADKFVFSKPEYAKIEPAAIETLFMNSLIENKWGFVNLFIENNFDISNFTDEERLKELYKVSFDAEKCRCAELLSDLISNTEYYVRIKKKEKSSEPDTLAHADIVIHKLSGNLLDSKYKECSKNKMIPNNTKTNKTVYLKEDEDDFSDEDETKKNQFSVKDLFLWSLISGRTELSLIFWKAGDDHIGSALIASNILQKMSDLVLVRGDNTLRASLKEAALKYEDRVSSIVTESYNRSKSKTFTLIVRELGSWNYLTCIDIAMHGNNLNFISHSACRSYTTKVWMGDLSPLLSTWKILFTIPLNLLMIKFVIMPSFPPKKLVKEHVTRDGGQKQLLHTEKEKTPDSTDYSKRYARPQITFFKAISIFYHAPIVKFYIHLLSYIAFLIIFTYLNLIELKPFEEVRAVKEVFSEIYVYVYVLTFIIEETRQLIDEEILNFSDKVVLYFSGTWNKFDALIILFFIISIITRFMIIQHHFVICRCLFALTLSMFYIRMMQFYFVNKSIGPKVIMIHDMLRDIFFFLSIFIIFLLAYGTLAQSLKFPNSKFDIALIKDIVYNPYFQTYGELMLDSFDNNGPCNGTDCIVRNTLILSSFAIFLLLTNILLINLLIAMFGYTFNQIQDESEKLWSFIQLQLVQEFYKKPILPPPFNILYYIFFFLIKPFKFAKEIFRKEDDLFSKTLGLDEYYRIGLFEKMSMDTVITDASEQKILKDEKTKDEMATMEDILKNVSVKPDAMVANNPTEYPLSFQLRFERRLSMIERQLQIKV